MNSEAKASVYISAFPTRIPNDKQAPKMASIWPIENVWSIVKDRVKAKEPKSKV